MKIGSSRADKPHMEKRVSFNTLIGFRGVFIGGAVVAVLVLIAYWALLATIALSLIRALFW